MKFVGYDLEISKQVVDNIPFEDQKPLGISCAVTIEMRGEEEHVRNWYGLIDPHQHIAAQMSRDDVAKLLLYLYEVTQQGGYVITLNGAGFDLRVTAEETYPELLSIAQQVALNHIDIGFQMVCEKGFMVGLRAACEGMMVDGKMKGMDGAQAPVLWASEDIADKRKVLAYCEQDVVATLNLYYAIVNSGFFTWISKSGRPNEWVPTFKPTPDGGQRLLTVAECLELPEPDTSWMSEPRTRSHYVDWLLNR